MPRGPNRKKRVLSLLNDMAKAGLHRTGGPEDSRPALIVEHGVGFHSSPTPPGHRFEVVEVSNRVDQEQGSAVNGRSIEDSGLRFPAQTGQNRGQAFHRLRVTRPGIVGQAGTVGEDRSKPATHGR